MSASEDELPLAFRIPLKNEDYKQWCADYCKAGGKRIDNVESFNIEDGKNGDIFIIVHPGEQHCRFDLVFEDNQKDAVLCGKLIK